MAFGRKPRQEAEPQPNQHVSEEAVAGHEALENAGLKVLEAKLRAADEQLTVLVASLARQGHRFYHQSQTHCSALTGGEKPLIGMPWAGDLVPRLSDYAETVAGVMSAKVSQKSVKLLQSEIKTAIENDQKVRLGVILNLHEDISAGEIYLVFSTFAGTRKDQLTVDLFWGTEKDLQVIKK